MLGTIRELGGFKNGEYMVATGATAYRGGHPAQVNTGGTVELVTTDTGATPFCGVFANAQAVDQLENFDYGRSGTGTGTTTTSFYRATIIAGNSLLRFQTGTKRGVTDAAPYDTALTFVPADLLYVGTGGLWTNVAPYDNNSALGYTGETSGETVSVARGHVLAVGSNYLDVQLY